MSSRLAAQAANGKGKYPIPVFAGEGGTSFGKHLRWKLKAASPEAEYMDVTPEMADEMLEYNSTEAAHNRPLSETTAEKYAQLMKDGYWGVDGLGTSEPIIFSSAARLLSGQHRLKAVIKAGITQRFLVVFGEPDGNFAYIDQGRRRTGADIFSLYAVPNYALAAASIGWVWAYEMGRMGANIRPSAQELYEFYVLHAKIQDSMAIGRAFSESRLAPPAVMVAMHYLCGRKSKSASDTFFDQVATGIGITNKGSPANKLRKRLIDNYGSASSKLSPVLIAAFTAKAWNAFRAGRTIGVLKWRTEQTPNEPFPKVS